MASKKKKIFKSASDVFKTYIPNYEPPETKKLRLVEKQPNETITKDFTDNLLQKFKDCLISIPAMKNENK